MGFVKTIKDYLEFKKCVKLLDRSCSYSNLKPIMELLDKLRPMERGCEADNLIDEIEELIDRYYPDRLVEIHVCGGHTKMIPIYWLQACREEYVTAFPIEHYLDRYVIPWLYKLEAKCRD